MPTPNSVVELKKALVKSQELERQARESAEKSNDIIARLNIQLDLERNYNSVLARHLGELKNRPPEVVEVPVVVEMVPEHIRQRLIQLSEGSRLLRLRLRDE